MKSKRWKPRDRKDRKSKVAPRRKVAIPLNGMVVPDSPTDTIPKVAGVLTLLGDVRSFDGGEHFGEGGHSLADGRSHVLTGCVEALLYVRRLIEQPGARNT